MEIKILGLVLSISCLVIPVAQAQYAYRPSIDHPFGLLNPEAPPETADFAPLVGECDCLSQRRAKDGEWLPEEKMLWRFSYILNGMGVQDESFREDGSFSGSIRQFNADSSKWYVHWYSNTGVASQLPAWEGSMVEDGKIQLYRPQTAPNGMNGFYRLTFYNMEKSGFDWIGEWVDEQETIVYPTWKISCEKTKD
ncbi:MAG: hypothetical protein KTR24_14075 [Saprospiraceae bacterium]|nr:hypothetical protein [Saprospiraceae bacterium]